MSGRGFRCIEDGVDRVAVQVNGKPVELLAGVSVLAGLMQHSVEAPDSATGPPDWFCGIGQCQRCRVRINGREAIACQAVVRTGDVIETQ